MKKLEIEATANPPNGPAPADSVQETGCGEDKDRMADGNQQPAAGPSENRSLGQQGVTANAVGALPSHAAGNKAFSAMLRVS